MSRRTIPTLTAADLVDRPQQWPTLERSELMRNPIVAMRRDTVQTPDGTSMVRDYVVHPGAVGIIAVDDDDQVILIRQYRHPAGFTLVEPPAGLLDVAGEDPRLAAARELAEEAQLAAEHWQVLVDVFTSPGGLQESSRVYLARGLRDAERPAGFVVAHEEAHMDVVRAPVADVAAAILAGRLQSPLLVSGILALMTVRSTGGEESLRSADVEWPARAQRDRVDTAR